MADCLEEMYASLKLGVVPTTAGNRLETAMTAFDARAEEAPLSDSERAQITGAWGRLEHGVAGGRAEDDILRGTILASSVSQEERDKALLDLMRTAGCVWGVADTITAAE